MEIASQFEFGFICAECGVVDSLGALGKYPGKYQRGFSSEHYFLQYKGVRDGDPQKYSFPV
ncbi:MAG: hypothetical protein A3H27_13060 [Acidobacteria bacterium RIFCSPLOWO2_02_FULL_59_13]|nr:MAG: hypothetical protein A3H27_13060 [Acidobacteria bacterium RIFCSPLOWO2_02_FULL_59_13]